MKNKKMVVKKEISEKIQDIISIIESKDNILILSHKRPDGDAIGSSLALKEALLQKNKQVKIFIPDNIPSTFNFLPGKEEIVKEVDTRFFNLAIFLDTGDLERCGLFQEIKEREIPFINIDHHPQKNPKGDIVLVDNSFGATAEIIYLLLKSADIEITKKIALSLLTGIFTDTGGFMHAATTSLSFQIASELLLKGARLDKIAKYANHDKSLATLKIWGKAILKAKKDPFSHAIISFIDRNDLEKVGASLDDLSGVVNLINSVKGAKYSLLLTEYKESYLKGTLRSNYYEGVNVKEIAEKYGGGGHSLASGFEIEGKVRESSRGWEIEGYSTENRCIENRDS